MNDMHKIISTWYRKT